MNRTVTTDEMIESLVRTTYGKSHPTTRDLYRQSLQALVALAKSEQRRELEMRAKTVRTPPGAVH